MINIPYIPYTYRIYHKPTKMYYYGCKFANSKTDIANPSLFWVKYFTTSEIVKELIRIFGKESFDIKITKIFSTAEQTTAWETKFLTKINAAKHPKFLNLHNSGTNKKFFFTELSQEKKNKKIENLVKLNKSSEKRKRVSELFKGKPKTEEHRRKIGLANKGKIRDEKQRLRVSEVHKGKILSESLRKVLSLKLLGNTRCLGYKHTEQTRENMRQAQLRRQAKLRENINV